MRITATAQGYLPLDTTLTLQKNLALPIRRDANLYGHVHFRLVGLQQPNRANIQIANFKTNSDANGVVELNIPIEQQQTNYPVSINNHIDTLYMPCGEDAVIVIE